MITTEQLSKILSSAIMARTERTLEHSCLIRNLVIKKEAYAQFGRTCVDRGIKEKLIKPISPTDNGLRCKINKKQLSAVAGASNRISYLPVADR